jgi:iron complex outermembrane receptor protein
MMALIDGQIGAHQLTAGGWWEENRHAKWRYLYALAANGANFAWRAWPDPGDRFYTYYDQQMQAHTTSAFVRDRWKLSDRLRIEVGVRALRVALSNRTITGAPAVNGRIVSADAFLPQLGMAWQRRGGAEIFANYNENMRAFGHGVFGTDQAGFDRVRATIRPETARTIEGGVRWRLDGLETVLAAFRIDFDHRLAFTSPCSAIETCASVPANVGSVRTTGVEAAATWRIAPALPFMAPGR